jgi:hypothetical protein
MTAGKVAIEDNAYDPKSAGAVRGSTENTMRMLASQGVLTSIIRLPPVVHGEGDRNGFIPFLIKNARKKGESAYLGEGSNRWPAVHKLDAPYGFDGAMEDLMWIGSGHCYRSHQLQSVNARAAIF